VLRITEIIEPMQQGFAAPWLCRGEDGALYVVKSHRAAGRNTLIAEWVVGKLGLLLGLPIPPMAMATFDRSKAEYTPHDIGKELAETPGFASRYVAGVLDFQLAMVDLVPQNVRADLLWFDWLVWNGDRNDGNTNLLWVPATSSVVVIDHNNAFVEATAESFFPTHVFRRELSLLREPMKQAIQPRFRHILGELDRIWQELPDAWTDDCPLTREWVESTLARCLQDEFWTTP
jgi:hypothetical protein